MTHHSELLCADVRLAEVAPGREGLLTPCAVPLLRVANAVLPGHFPKGDIILHTVLTKAHSLYTHSAD